MDRAYALPNKRLRIFECRSSSQRFAVMGGVSSTSGRFTYISKPKFFDRFDTIKFLQQLRSENPNHKIAVFWDNCSIHYTKEVKAELRRLKIPTIMNVPYSPWFNGIEHLWGRFKWLYRRYLLELKIKEKVVSLRSIVPMILAQTTNEFNLRCALRGEQTLLNKWNEMKEH